MSFVIGKIISLLINPFLWFLTLVLLALINFWRGKKVKKLIYLALIILIIFSNGLPLKFAKNLYSTPQPPDKLEEVYDLAIVLGGYAGFSDANNDIEWHDASDRILYPLKWYKTGKVKTILLSGGSGNLVDTSSKEAILIKNWLLEIGVSNKDIIVESQSRNTYENAKYTKFFTSNYKKILLVTSAIHGKRAHAVFSKMKINTRLITVDNPSQKYSGTDLTFSPENLVEWKYLLHEMIGYIAYKVQGYL